MSTVTCSSCIFQPIYSAAEAGENVANLLSRFANNFPPVPGTYIQLFAAWNNPRFQRLERAIVVVLVGDVVDLEGHKGVPFLGAHEAEPLLGATPGSAPLAAHDVQCQLAGGWNRDLIA